MLGEITGLTPQGVPASGRTVSKFHESMAGDAVLTTHCIEMEMVGLGCQRVCRKAHSLLVYRAFFRYPGIKPVIFGNF